MTIRTLILSAAVVLVAAPALAGDGAAAQRNVYQGLSAPVAATVLEKREAVAQPNRPASEEPANFRIQNEAVRRMH